MKKFLPGFVAVLFLVGLISFAIFLSAYKENTYVSPAVRAAMQQYVAQALRTPSYGAMLPIAGQTYNLAGSGLSQTATSITLASFTVTQTGQKIQDADLGDIFYITLEPGSISRQEIVSCTTDVQNSNGSATFSGCTRGLSPIQPYTASTTMRFSHGGGTQVIFSNPPQFYNQFGVLSNINVFTATNTFATTTFNPAPTVTTGFGCSTLSANNTLCDKSYIDGVAVAGASNANETTKGIVEMATARESASSTILGGTAAGLAMQARYSTDTPQTGCAAGFLTAGSGCNVIALLTGKISQAWLDLTASFTFSGGLISSGVSTFTGLSTFTATSTQATTTVTGLNIGGNITTSMIASTTLTPYPPIAVYQATSTGAVLKSDANSLLADDFIGFAVSSAVNGGSVLVQTAGVVNGFTGLATGTAYYVQNSAGTIGAATGTAELFVGRAVSTTAIRIESPANMQFISSQTISSGGGTIQVPAFTRTILIEDNASQANITSESTLTLTRNGSRSAALIGSTCCALVSFSSTFVWSIPINYGAGGSLTNVVSGYSGQTALVSFYR